MLVYFIVKNKPWAWVISALFGVSYFLVYALDLGKIFPVSPDPMPPTLYMIEVLGAIVSVPLIFFAVRGAMVMGDRQETATIPASYSKQFGYIISCLAIVGIGIIIFATQSAMGH